MEVSQVASCRPRRGEREICLISTTVPEGGECE